MRQRSSKGAPTRPAIRGAPRTQTKAQHRRAARRRGDLSPGELLGSWQASELQLARSFTECSGLSDQQLEDIYQETTIALLARDFEREEHVRNALREGIKHRALNLHRDERRHQEIIAGGATSLSILPREDQDSPEQATVAREDRLIVSEFLTELTTLEQQIFWLEADGMKYNRISDTLGIDVKLVRNALRSCEHKRKRFQALYDTGRLCGFRASTIQALQNGELTSEELAHRAFVHLEGCASCRAEHRTNATRLRHSFRDQAAALLPVPALLGRSNWLSLLSARARSNLHRLRPDTLTFGQGAIRERATALIAGGGVAAKATAGAATVAVVAAGAVGATHALSGKHTLSGPTPAHLAIGAQTGIPSFQAGAATTVSPPSSFGYGRPVSHTDHERLARVPGHIVPAARTARRPKQVGGQEPGRIAYLAAPVQARSPRRPEPLPKADEQTGGLFTP